MCVGHAHARVWHVDFRSITLTPTGTNWDSAFPTIQQGIDAAANDGGGEVWVRWGRYSEQRFALVDSADAGSLVLRDGVELYGGFRGDETVRTDRDWVEFPTIIDGATSRLGFLPAHHVVFAAPQSRIDGLIIEGGETLPVNALNGWGAGLLALEATGFTMAHCTIRFNTASSGGGAFIFSGTDITLLNNRVHENFAAVSGGGVHCIGGADVRIINTVIDRNEADRNSPSSSFGGGIVCEQGAQVDVWHCTIWDNIAPNGNAAAILSQSNATFRNSILWSLETLEIAEGGLASLSISSSVVKGGFNGANNIAVNPQLASPARGDFLLRTDSPCIDAAQVAGQPLEASADREGIARPQRGAPDIGAHELPFIAHVDNATVRPVQDGLAWDTAFDTIQEAIDDIAAKGGGEVWVARGNYGEDRTGTRADGALQMRSGVDVYGEFACFERYRSARRFPDLLERDPILTVINGAAARGGSPAFHVVVAAANSMLEGFRITGGVADGTAAADKNGAGLYVDDDTFRLTRCQVDANRAVGTGGGAYWSGSGRWDRVAFTNNMADDGGGIAFVNGGDAIVSNGFFIGNAAADDGGGVFATSTDVLLRHCAIIDNSASLGGGILTGFAADLTFANGILRDNNGGQANSSLGTIRIRHSNRVGTGGEDNINESPRFYSNEFPYDLRLEENSPSIDRGNIDDSPGHDASGRARMRRVAPDHGPHEMRPVIYVDLDNDAAPVRDGTSWARALTFLQDGVDAATVLRGADLWVAEGVYREQRSSDVDGVDTGSLRLARDVHLYGGFANGETSAIARDIRSRVTTISGLGVRGGANATHTILGANFAIVDGFTIRDGAAQSNVPHRDGGGVWNDRASMTLRNCLLRGNVATDRGAGVFNMFSDLRMENVVVADNRAGEGAIANDRAWFTARHLTVADNIGTPGAFLFDDSEGFIGNSILWFNGAPSFTIDAQSTVEVGASNVQDGFVGNGNIVATPLFENRGTLNYRLSNVSPGIDAGSAKFGLSVDADESLRPGGLAFDMGAYEAPDSDRDGILDSIEGTGDPDRDGLPNYLDPDSDGDGILDLIEGAGDTDGDLIPDFLDLDSDGDGISDEDEGAGDVDGDDIPNFRDLDSDGDTLSDRDETTIHLTNPYAADSDMGGLNDAFELDAGTNPLDGSDDLTTLDVNGDNQLNASDIQIVINAVLGINTPFNTDTNRDGVTNASDIQLTILAVLGLL